MLKGVGALIVVVTAAFHTCAQPRAVYKLFKALEVASSDTARANICYSISRLYWNKNSDSTLLMAERSLVFAHQANYERGKALAYLSKGVAWLSKGKYPEALENHLQALRISEKLHMEGLTANNYNNIGIVYSAMKEYARALDYFQRSLSIMLDNGEDKIAFALLINIAAVHRKHHNYDSALSYNMKALAMATKRRDTLSIGTALFHIGDVYLETGRYETALQDLQRSLMMTHDSLEADDLTRTYDRMAKALCKLHRFPESIRYAEQSLQKALALGNYETALSSCNTLYESHRALQHFEIALTFRNREIGLKDSLYSIQKEKEIAGLQAAYEIEKKQYTISLLEKDNEIKRQQLSRVRIFTYAAFGALLVLSMLVFILHRRNTTRKVINQLLEKRHQETNIRKEEIVRQNWQLQELNSVKNKLLSIISHDLRSPLNSLRGIVDLLRHEALTLDEIKSISYRISENLTVTSHLLDNLLFWAKSQMEGTKVRPGYFNLWDVIRQNARLAQSQAETKSIAIQLNDAENPCRGYGDPAMIDIVVRNILANAIKFSNPGGTITLSAHLNTNYVHVSIRDTGMGIAAQDQPWIFNSPSFTTEGTAREKGTGLGLVLCKDLVEKNGGTISFQTQLHEGTTFTFTVPAHPPLAAN